VNAIALADTDAFRIDSDLFGAGIHKPFAQQRFRASMAAGLQTREGEMELGKVLGNLADN
jgi:hypothetical protein